MLWRRALWLLWHCSCRGCCPAYCCLLHHRLTGTQFSFSRPPSRLLLCRRLHAVLWCLRSLHLQLRALPNRAASSLRCRYASGSPVHCPESRRDPAFTGFVSPPIASLSVGVLVELSPPCVRVDGTSGPAVRGRKAKGERAKKGQAKRNLFELVALVRLMACFPPSSAVEEPAPVFTEGCRGCRGCWCPCCRTAIGRGDGELCLFRGLRCSVPILLVTASLVALFYVVSH
ncbi:hypothetical protein HOY80DRAFT_226926 [Tuber brumale]|nr:hypothetical protein HOY80DRAFT_226926 [Tuber brumale]